MARCELTDLAVDQCAHCRGVEEPPRDPGPMFTAAYYGSCSDCQLQIDPGDQIRADGEGGYLCEDCGGA